jgi:mono/diheme cytochrome c family protein
MITNPKKLEEVSVFRRLSPAFGLVAALVPAMIPALANAQTNIDQGKTPAEIFATDCATCHKTPRGLANGKNTLMLSGFLREHYTASREQAAALAAYVLGAGGSGPAPQAPGQKPALEHARTTVEEPKTAEPKPAARSTRLSAKPEEERSGTATRGQKKEPEEATPPTQEPAPVVATPANGTPRSAETPSQEVRPTTSAAAPTESEPNENAPVPRDNIPD